MADVEVLGDDSAADRLDEGFPLVSCQLREASGPCRSSVEQRPTKTQLGAGREPPSGQEYSTAVWRDGIAGASISPDWMTARHESA
ncbi:hypothetical protein [Streptomyces ochraceiscleroticus]|uniref:Uncharacterized protein n=1 Tax=Streptomyces ochraceiscleroticus TaxID=47761 RepID=A0ABW1MRX8_9ACTN|nr:hypothetical protein [Streptomyces ochraceiscleroticus]